MIRPPKSRPSDDRARSKFKSLAKAFESHGNPAGIPEEIARDLLVQAAEYWLLAERCASKDWLDGDNRLTEAAKVMQASTGKYLATLRALGLLKKGAGDGGESLDEF